MEHSTNYSAANFAVDLFVPIIARCNEQTQAGLLKREIIRHWDPAPALATLDVDRLDSVFGMVARPGKCFWDAKEQGYRNRTKSHWQDKL